MGELYRRLKAYSETDEYPYHMPGHKRQVCGELPQEIMNIDITEIDGFDNLHAPEEILLRLQEEAARLYGAEESFYLVNGSTCGVLAAISAAVPKGGRLLMTRGGHKSAYHAAYLRNLTISYLYPEMMQEYDIYDAITPEQIAEALQIIGCTLDEKVYRQLNLLWGVKPVMIQKERTTDALFEEAVFKAKQAGLVKTGDTVVITAGVPLGVVGKTDMIHVVEVE